MRKQIVAAAAILGCVAWGVLAAATAMSVPGCSATQKAKLRADEAIVVADLHAAATWLLGILHAAKGNPALVDEAKALATAAVQSAAPKDVPTLQKVLDHVNAGNVDKAISVLEPVVAATAPATPSADVARVGS